MIKAVLNVTLRVDPQKEGNGADVLLPGHFVTGNSIEEMPDYIRYELKHRPFNVTLSEYHAEVEEVVADADAVPGSDAPAASKPKRGKAPAAPVEVPDAPAAPSDAAPVVE